MSVHRGRDRGCRRWVGGVVVLAWAISCAVSANAQTPTPAKPRIALLPMVVHSAESPDYLRSGLSDMITARFTQENVLEVVRIDDPSKATTDVRAALEVARAVDAEFVLFGSFTRFGQGASLDVQTAAAASGPSGETLREIFVHSGSIGKVIPDLDDLVGKVTRFAVADYRPGQAAPAGAAGATPAVDPMQAVLKRLEVLEAEVAELRESSGQSGQ